MALIDDILTPISASLTTNLSWLDNAYGKVEKLVRKGPDGQPIIYPGVFVGEGTDDYISVLPDGALGNYCFFDIDPIQEYNIVNRHAKVSFKFKLVFCFDWRVLYPSDWQTRSIEEVKDQILTVLVATRYTRSVETFTISENAKEVFGRYSSTIRSDGYSHDEIKIQFAMRPYGILAISGEIYGASDCNLSGSIPSIQPNIYGLIPVNYSGSETLYAIEKWYGENIFFRTWSLSSGAGDYESLTGLVAADIFVVKTEYRAINTVTGTVETGSIQLEVDGTGYKVFTPDFFTDIFVTVYYKNLA